MTIAVLMPCLNEAEALPVVLAELPPGLRVVVCDNGSTDGSPGIAQRLGTEVAYAAERGYGNACLAGIAALRADPPDVVVIWDADHAIYADDLPELLAPIEADRADLVLGDRTALAAPGALTPPQRFGNRLATTIIGRVTGFVYRDMGPFRAIRWAALERLQMEDPTWGWNVEMQLKAVQRGLRVVEVPVRYRARIGQSKISGTVSGVVRAGGKILYACWRYAE